MIRISLLLILATLFACRSTEPMLSPFDELPRRGLPVAFKGGVDAPSPGVPALEDSAYIVDYINPAYFSEAEPQYAYYEGTVISETDSFTAVVYPIAHTFGYDYLLVTYDAAYQQLDTLLLAETAGDYYAQSAQIQEDGRISINRNYLSLPESTLRRYRILPSGYIDLDGDEIAPPDGAAKGKPAWAGAYYQRTALPDRRAELTIQPTGSGDLLFSLTYTWGEDVNVRGLQGTARRNGDQAVYTNGDCTLTFQLSPSAVRVQHQGGDACSGAGSIDFSGDYLGAPRYEYKQLIEDIEHSIGSCITYRVVDGADQLIEVSGELEQLLECPAMLGIAPDWTYLVVSGPPGIHTYHFATRTLQRLVAMPETVEGYSSPLWSPDGRRIAFVSIDQDQYPELTKLHELTLDAQGKLAEARDHAVPVHFYCPSACTSQIGRDLWYDDAGKLHYRTPEHAGGEERVVN